MWYGRMGDMWYGRMDAVVKLSYTGIPFPFRERKGDRWMPWVPWSKCVSASVRHLRHHLGLAGPKERPPHT